MHVTRVFRENLRAFKQGYRVIPNRGGTRSGKTYSIMQLLIIIALKRKGVTIDVVSESVPHLKRGSMRDLETILDDLKLIETQHYARNRTDNIVSFPTGGSIRFFSGDDWGKIKGSRRQILFVNECNRLPFEVFRQLDVRTTGSIFLDWNPDSEFWFEQQNIKTRETTAPEIVSTYKDNLDNLTAAQIEAIEANRADENWWKVYGLGQVGKKQGLVYTRWETCKQLPETFKKQWIGLDFGFTNDPTAIVFVGLSEGKLYLKELCYRRNMTNKDIYEELGGVRRSKEKLGDNTSDFANRQPFHHSTQASPNYPLPPLTTPNLLIVADSAEPKSIAELKGYGLNIESAQKGADSIKNGIDILQRYPLMVTQDSFNLLDELRHYCYAEDRDGNLLNRPIDKYNHALDAVRYVALNHLSERPKPKGMKRTRLV